MAGAATIGSLNVEMGLNTASFDAGLAKTKAGLASLNLSKGFAAGIADVKRSLSSAAGGAGALGAALGGLGIVGVGAAAGIAAGFIEVKKALAFGDDIADTAKRLAVTTDALQEYRYAVHQLGGDYTDADAALEGFSKAFGAAQGKLSAKALKPFKALGLDPADFRDSEEALQAVIARIADLKSAAEQAAIADKLGIGSMLPAIREGAQRINELRLAAHALGFVMSEDLVNKAGDANDRFEDLSHILDVQFKSAMVDLAPIVLGIAEALGVAARGARALSEQLAKIDPSDLAVAVPVIGGVLRTQVQINQARAAAKRNADLQSGLRDVAAGKKFDFSGARPTSPTGSSLIAPGGKGGGGGTTAKQRAEASEQAIAAAAQRELDARIRLTANIAAVAALRETQVRTEAQAEVDRLKRDAAEGKITQAAAQKAIALEQQATDAQVQAIQRQKEADEEDALVKSREAIGRYYDQIAQITAGMATTAAKQNQIETDALIRRQATERARLSSDLEQDVISGARTDSERDALIASQADLHAAERLQQEREAQVRLVAEALARTQGALEVEIAGLQAQADLTESQIAREQIERRILELRRKQERAELESVRDGADKQVDRDLARARLDLLDLIEKGQKGMAAKLSSMLGAFDATESAIGTFASAIEREDWVGAFRAFSKTVSETTAAFNKLGTTAGKIGVAAGVAAGVGNAIGGKAGGALSGAAGGALAGAQLGSIVPGIGTAVGAAIGGILGGLGGLFGASKAKKRAKKQAEEQARLEKERAAAEEVAKKRELEIALMRASGDAAGAQAAEEADLLAALSPANQELQKQVWALEKQADAAAAAAELARQERDLKRELLEATGHSTEALAMFREDALAELPPALRVVKQAIFDAADAADALAKAEATYDAAREQAADIVAEQRERLGKAYEQEASRLTALRDRFKALADTLGDLGRELRSGDLAGQTAAQKLAATRARFQRVSAAAATGDEQALADLPDAARAFVEASKVGSADAKAFGADLAAVKRSVAAAEAVARMEADTAAEQLTALQEMVAGQIEVRDEVIRVQDALLDLASAINFQAAVNDNAVRAITDLKDSLKPALEGVMPKVGSFDAAAFSASLTPVSGSPDAKGMSDASAISQAVSAALVQTLGPGISQMVSGVTATADLLDDVINGPLTLNTAAA